VSEVEGFWLGMLLGSTFVWPIVYALSVVMSVIDPYRGVAWQTLIRLHCWLWFPAGPGYLWLLTDATANHEYVFAAFDLLTLVLWWNARNWPDDQWKRRKKKVKEAVAVLGRRLVVRTAPA
jgi:hypothetical protein